MTIDIRLFTAFVAVVFGIGAYYWPSAIGPFAVVVGAFTVGYYLTRDGRSGMPALA